MAKGGVKEAAKLLVGLGLKGREAVLDIIAKKDPKMAEMLKENLVQFEDLKLLTPSMLQDLLKEIDRDDLGRALRASSDQLKEFFLNSVSSSFRKDLEEILLGPPLSLDKINESKEKILELVKDKMDKGLIILKDDDEDYV